jgi:hydrogenase/urease accessory protein HupE
MTRPAYLIAASLAATPALAHPGHEAAPVTHWVSDLSHLAVVVALAALCVTVLGIARARRRRSRARRD